MTGAEVKKLRDEEITVELKTLRQKLFDLRNQTVTDKVADVSQFGKLRKDIARLLTEQTGRARPGTGTAAAKPVSAKTPARPVSKAASKSSPKTRTKPTWAKR